MTTSESPRMHTAASTNQSTSLASASAYPSDDHGETMLSAYHKQALLRARIDIWLSRALAIGGFLMLVVSALTLPTGVSVSGIIVSLLIEVLAGILRREAKHSIKQMSMFFDRLRADKRLSEAVRQCELIEGKRLRDSVRATLALRLSEFAAHDAPARSDETESH